MTFTVGKEQHEKWTSVAERMAAFQTKHGQAAPPAVPPRKRAMTESTISPTPMSSASDREPPPRPFRRPSQASPPTQQKAIPQPERDASPPPPQNIVRERRNSEAPSARTAPTGNGDQGKKNFIRTAIKKIDKVGGRLFRSGSGTPPSLRRVEEPAPQPPPAESLQPQADPEASPRTPTAREIIERELALADSRLPAAHHAAYSDPLAGQETKKKPKGLDCLIKGAWVEDFDTLVDQDVRKILTKGYILVVQEGLMQEVVPEEGVSQDEAKPIIKWGEEFFVKVAPEAFQYLKEIKKKPPEPEKEKPAEEARLPSLVCYHQNDALSVLDSYPELKDLGNADRERFFEENQKKCFPIRQASMDKGLLQVRLRKDDEEPTSRFHFPGHYSTPYKFFTLQDFETALQ